MWLGWHRHPAAKNDTSTQLRGLEKDCLDIHVNIYVNGAYCSRIIYLLHHLTGHQPKNANIPHARAILRLGHGVDDLP